MSKFNTGAPVAPRSPIRTSTPLPDTQTHEGGLGFTRDAKSDLFLLAVSNLVGEDTFYEGSTERDARFRSLIRKVVAEDPDWVARFVPFMRNTMQMRSASVVMAAEYALAGGPKPRAVVADALQRADEPGEFLAYWKSRTGKTPRGGVQRGLADAVKRLYNERAALKWDSDARGWRMGDVIEVTHPQPSAEWQSALFRFLIDRRHNRDDAWERIPEGVLQMVAANRGLNMLPVEERREFLQTVPAEVFTKAGMTWEALSGWLQGSMDAEAWEKIIPSMGYMALLRNLRNFDQAGISPEHIEYVTRKIADPDEVAHSRQFPFRFYSAWKNTESLNWAGALESAVNASLQNVPRLEGRTLIMIDTSGSMFQRASRRSTIDYWEQAALFGLALALRAEDATTLSYSDDAAWLDINRGASLLRMMDEFRKVAFQGGTRTLNILSRAYDGHDRVVILTDEQAFAPDRRLPRSWSRNYGLSSEMSGVWSRVEAIKAPIYTFNLAGYGKGHLPSGESNRYTFGGGLTDAAFRILSLLEQRQSADWPF